MEWGREEKVNNNCEKKKAATAAVETAIPVPEDCTSPLIA